MSYLSISWSAILAT